MKRLTSIVGIAGLVAIGGMAVGGCGASSPAIERAEVRNTYASIRAAEAVGATKVPDAALHLELAREQMVRSQRLAKMGETARARRLLKRARADADLAMTLTRARVAREQAEAAQEQLTELEAEVMQDEATEGSER